VAIINGYATLAEAKTRLNIPSTTTTYDAVLEASIEAASRVIDDDCNRMFYAVTETRYYTPDDPLSLFLEDDVTAVTLVKTLSVQGGGYRTYGFVWTVNDWDLEPYGGPPYSRLIVNPTGRYVFPTIRRGVEITGTFGYCATGSHPRAINEACLRMTSRLFERNKAPLGVISSDMVSTRIASVDVDYTALIRPYRKMDMVVQPSW
jgi:hypothetical protein